MDILIAIKFLADIFELVKKIVKRRIVFKKRDFLIILQKNNILSLCLA